MGYMSALGERARKSAAALAVMRTAQKNDALYAMAKALRAGRAAILAENGRDLAAAQENGMSAAMTDRLRLDGQRIEEMARAVEYVAGLDDPVGAVLGGGLRPNGLSITKVAVPFGVVGVIFESRPNVTVDCAALCFKAGSACILRGGKEAIHSNKALAGTMRAAIAGAGVPADAVLLVEDTAREISMEMMRLNAFIDVLIPRGSAGLINAVVQNATVPVIETGAGVCHAFIDESADMRMALDITDNAKTARPSVCNAIETVLVHAGCAAEFLPRLEKRLAGRVELRGCERTREILLGIGTATDDDWYTEYGDYILSVKVVADIGEAVEHIRKYGTHHSEVIVTRDLASSRRFTSEVDSAAVYVNASTRFTDGGEFGLGAEIGISTQKLHARGPMGLRELVSYKYIIAGNGQIR